MQHLHWTVKSTVTSVTMTNQAAQQVIIQQINKTISSPLHSGIDHLLELYEEKAFLTRLFQNVQWCRA